MKIGTLGFVGARLREAREARGLTANGLAELIGVSKQAVSRYENGADSPHPPVMQRISAALNLPTQYFLRPSVAPSEVAIYFRSMSAATKAARVRAGIRLRWAELLVDYLKDFLEFPAVDFPRFPVPLDPKMISAEQIEDLAVDVRRHWQLGIGPISNVVWLLENRGAIVIRDELGASTLDALSVWSGDRPYIMLGAEKGSAARSRFDAAHELGHMILHRYIAPSRIVNPNDFRVMEDQAHRFAAAFLLPQAAFTKELILPTIDALVTMKARWHVSIGMMIKRIDDLGLASPGQVQQLYMSYSRRKWRTNEPLDDAIPVEEPRLIRLSIELALDAGVFSMADLPNGVPLSPMDIERLGGLPDGMLGDDPPQVRLLSLEAKRAERGRRRRIFAPDDDAASPERQQV